MKSVGILRFPGTNCDRDIWQAVEAVGSRPQWLWHSETFDPKQFEALVVPGGFSYGDYLRTGALAAMSPVMESLSEAAKKGVPILGICNGFQILCEARLLPGVLLKNDSLKFMDKWVHIEMVGKSPWTQKFSKKEKIKLPIAHGEGRYFVSESELKKLQDKNQVLCTYSENPNGSVSDIAGVMNEAGNVVALMPHPERALFDWMGSKDGLRFFDWM